MKRNKLIIWCLIIFSIVLAILTGGRLPYLIFFTCICIYLYSYYSVKKASTKMYDFFWISNEDAKVGDTLKIRYKIYNDSLFPIPYSEIKCVISKRLGNMTFPKEIVFFSPMRTIFIIKEFECKHRGYYSLGEVHVKIFDVFNLFQEEISFSTKIDLLVYPRVIEITRMNIPATEYFGSVRVPFSNHEDYTSISNIGKYIEGDNVKKINWKASAKMDNILVNKFELSANIKVNIFLDGYFGSFSEDASGDVEEKIVETTASIINYCLRKNMKTSLVTNTLEKRYFEARDLDRFRIFLKELMGYLPNGNIRMDEFLRVETRKLSYGSTLIILTTKLDERLFSTLINLRNQKFNILLILVRNPTEEEEMNDNLKTEYLKKLGIDIYLINLESDIVAVLEGSI